MNRERRIQLLTERAGRRWSRRVQARLANRRPGSVAAVASLRRLEDQADALFRHLRDLDGPDGFAAQLRKAGEREPRNPDDPDDDGDEE